VTSICAVKSASACCRTDPIGLQPNEQRAAPTPSEDFEPAVAEIDPAPAAKESAREPNSPSTAGEHYSRKARALTEGIGSFSPLVAEQELAGR
jgi:hypothetical protein